MAKRIAWISGYPAHYMRVLHLKLEKKYAGSIAFFYLEQSSEQRSQRIYEKGDYPQSAKFFGNNKFFRVLSLIRDVHTFSADMLVMSGSYPKPILVAGLFFKLMGKHICYWSDTNIHDIYLRRGLWRFVKWFIFNSFLRKMAYLFYIGSANRDFYIWAVGRNEFDNKKVFVPYPHNHEEYVKKISKRKKNEESKLRLLSVSRLIKIKAINNVIEALSLLPQDIKGRLTYTIVGDGPERKNIENAITRYSLEDTVRMLGMVDSKKVAGYLLESDLFIFPSELEPWGIVVNEAMSLGVPVLAPFWIGAAQDLVINGYTGILVDDNKPVTLANAIMYALENMQEVERLSANCVRHLEVQGCVLEESLKNLSSVFGTNS
jgi:glycosyltransferase involved in cell wall biosynthesis